MSAKASRRRLEEELRIIVDQEEKLNAEVNNLLQARSDPAESRSMASETIV